MPATDITNTINHQKDIDILTSIHEDLTMIRTWGNTLAAKLNADAGVTDTNYATIGALGTTV